MAQSKLAAAPRLGARPGVPLPGIGRAILLTGLAIEATGHPSRYSEASS